MKQMKYYSKKLVAMGLAVLFMVASMRVEVPALTFSELWNIDYSYGAPSNVSNQGYTLDPMAYTSAGYYENCYSLEIATGGYLRISVSTTTSGYSMGYYTVTTTGNGAGWTVTRSSDTTGEISFLIMAQNCTRCTSTGRVIGR